MPAVKSLMDSANAGKFIEMLIQSKTNFDLYASNYTMKIEINGDAVNFIKSEQSNMVFAAFRKLQSDLKDKKNPNIQAEEVSYFIHNFREAMYVENVFNIDLKSAYINIFLMNDLISRETYKYVCSLQKKDRLAAVGMLASRKEIFHFKNGAPNGMPEISRSEFSGFFFYAVKKTAEIMGELKKICGKNYLFTWVDGIYFLPDHNQKKECQDYLKMIGFPYAFDTLHEFEVKMMSDYINVTFLEEDNVYKEFNLPFHDNQFKKIMSDILINSKFKTNEKNKGKNSRKQG